MHKHMNCGCRDHKEHHEPYSEAQTEQVRQAERAADSTELPSSAGVPTQRLDQTYQAAPPARAHAHQGGMALIGIATIVLGVLLLLVQLGLRSMSIDLTPGLVLLTIASCFLFFAFWRRVYGLLIPGCILSGLALGVPLADLSNGVSVLWGLSLGFLAILLVGRAYCGVRSSWPVYPAVILFAVGTITAVSSLPSFLAVGLFGLPLLLVGLGLYLGLGRYQHC